MTKYLSKTTASIILKDLLKKHSKTYENVAEITGVSINTVSNWLKGDTFPPIEHINAIAQLLDMQCYELVAHIMQEKVPHITLQAFLEFAKQTTGITCTMNESMMILTCTRIVPRIPTGIYPQNAEEAIISNLFDRDITKHKTENYCIVNGNIYPFDSFLTDDPVLECRNYNGIQSSIFSYINEGNNIKEMKKAYVKKRHLFGILGTLSANDFYWLNYIIGYITKGKN